MLGFGVALWCNLSVTVTVGLISGKTVTVEAGLDEDVKIVNVGRRLPSESDKGGSWTHLLKF